MSWQVKKTDEFEKWWKKEKIEDSNYKFHEEALKEFRNVVLPTNQSCHFTNSSFECWSSRLPDKARKQGKQGGFRVVFIIDIEEATILLQGIFRRNNLSYKGSGGKYDSNYEDLVKNLAKIFVEIAH